MDLQNATNRIAAQGELPDGEFARLRVPPYGEDELILAVSEVERYPLQAWNEALSRAVGRRVSCPSYRVLTRRLEEAIRGEN